MNVYYTSGVCSKEIRFIVSEGILVEVDFLKGCSGNLLGIKKLVEGHSIDDIIKTLGGIPCGKKATSCPDQLAKALEEYKLCL